MRRDGNQRDQIEDGMHVYRTEYNTTEPTLSRVPAERSFQYSSRLVNLEFFLSPPGEELTGRGVGAPRRTVRSTADEICGRGRRHAYGHGALIGVLEEDDSEKIVESGSDRRESCSHRPRHVMYVSEWRSIRRRTRDCAPFRGEYAFTRRVLND